MSRCYILPSSYQYLIFQQYQIHLTFRETLPVNIVSWEFRTSFLVGDSFSDFAEDDTFLERLKDVTI